MNSASLVKASHQASLLAADDPSWQSAWLTIRSENWRSLAVVTIGEQPTLEIVHALASVAWQQRGTPLVVADLRTVSLRNLDAVQGELQRRVDNGETILVAVGSVEQNPAAVTIARAVDKAVVCAELGKTPIWRVRDVIQKVGSEQFLGAILLDAGRS